MMTYNELYKLVKNQKDDDPPITNQLISGFGYMQKTGGYIELAKSQKITNPTQKWHLITYCKAKIKAGKGDTPYRYTPCGELVIYIAEISGAVPDKKLRKLVNKIGNSGEINNRKKWNAEIRRLCWDEIKKVNI